MLDGRLVEPVLEPDVSESRVAGGYERTFAQFCFEVPRVRIDNNLAPNVACAKALAAQFVEAELLRTRHINGAVHWGAHGDHGNRLGDVVSGHGLNEYWWQPNGRSDGGIIGDALDELEELRGVNNRVRDSSILDQCLLSGLRAEVRTVWYPAGSHDG